MAAVTEMTELRVILHDGYVHFINASPKATYKDFGTFSFSKINPYSKLVTEMYENRGDSFKVAQVRKDDGELMEVEGHGSFIAVHITATLENPWWRRMFYWELEFGCEDSHRPGFHEPFRELLALIEKAHDAFNDGRQDGNGTPCTDNQCDEHQTLISEAKGVTADASILKLARLYWAAMHLQLQAPLYWDKELRTILMQEINNINTFSVDDKDPAFRAVDFWYIWGAFRGLDDELVEAMVLKLAEAKANRTDPRDLEKLNTDVAELEQWLEKVQHKKGKRSLAQVNVGMHGRRANEPPPLNLSNSHAIATTTTAMGMTKPPNTAIYLPPLGRYSIKGYGELPEPPKTAPMAPAFTILRCEGKVAEEAVMTAGDEDKKSKGKGYTAPTGMAPPPPSGKDNSRGGKKKRNSIGNKRGKETQMGSN